MAQRGTAVAWEIAFAEPTPRHCQGPRPRRSKADLEANLALRRRYSLTGSPPYDPTFADAICDWPLHTAHRIVRKGPLYDAINERYGKASIILTSNRDRSEWPELFGEALLASAALDRLTRGAHFVEITGPSFRAEATKKIQVSFASRRPRVFRALTRGRG